MDKTRWSNILDAISLKAFLFVYLMKFWPLVREIGVLRLIWMFQRWTLNIVLYDKLTFSDYFTHNIQKALGRLSGLNWFKSLQAFILSIFEYCYPAHRSKYLKELHWESKNWRSSPSFNVQAQAVQLNAILMRGSPFAPNGSNILCDLQSTRSLP